MVYARTYYLCEDVLVLDDVLVSRQQDVELAASELGDESTPGCRRALRGREGAHPSASRGHGSCRLAGAAAERGRARLLPPALHLPRLGGRSAPSSAQGSSEASRLETRASASGPPGLVQAREPSQIRSSSFFPVSKPDQLQTPDPCDQGPRTWTVLSPGSRPRPTELGWVP